MQERLDEEGQPVTIDARVGVRVATTMSPVALVRPTLRAALNPPFGMSMTRTRGCECPISLVRSREPSLTRMIRSSDRSTARAMTGYLPACLRRCRRRPRRRPSARSPVPTRGTVRRQTRAPLLQPRPSDAAACRRARSPSLRRRSHRATTRRSTQTPWHRTRLPRTPRECAWR